MSDRSFGDHAFRNVVKNPLLSTSVTGLSIEDLTHNAVLLPAVPSQEMSTRRDERSGSQTSALRHSEHETANLPSGDTNFNIYPPSTLTDVGLGPSNPQITSQNVRPHDSSTVNVSKASAKSDDDFDVNEYFARLQGTRYVSAPLNSVLKEDKNANLRASEENLEEINLNEPAVTSQDVQQSITADIAQNFSQLPTVLPQMASVVFNSFSSMLSMKSREQTPEESKRAYQEVNVRPAETNPQMGVPDIVKDLAPPPLKEPPVVGTGNYRITTRKKVYAQIPGLSTNDTTQTMPYQPPVNQPYFIPDVTTYTADKDVKNDFNNAISAEAKGYDIFAPSQVDVTSRDARDGIEQVNVNFSNQTTLREAIAPLNAPSGIPPPPVSICLSKKDQTVGKSVLPPSVARRISANQPIIKSQPPSMPQYSNIFVPQSTEAVEESRITQALGAAVSSVPTVPLNIQTSLPEKQAVLAPGLPPMPPMNATVPNVAAIPTIDMQTSLPEKLTTFAPGLPMSTNISASNATVSSVPAVPTNLQTSLPTTFASGLSPISTNISASNATVPSVLAVPTNMQTNLPEKSPTFSPPSFTTTNISQTAIITPGDPPPSSTLIHSQTDIKLSATQSISRTNSIPFPSNVLPPIGVPTAVSSQEPIKTAPVIPPPIKPSMLPPPPTNIKAQASETITGTSQIETKPLHSPPNVSQTIFGTANLSQDKSNSDQNISTPPMFFNPGSPIQPPLGLPPGNQVTLQNSQFFNPNDVPPAPTASVPEPPRSQGVTNYRMTKKRPQYYSGPIEGVGSISNNIKPVFSPVQAASYHGTLFTPQEPEPLTQSEPSFPGADSGAGQIPFDSFTMPPISSHNYGTATTVPQNVPENSYDTAFDFSRPAADRYEPPQETGFGLIGSLKSKLSSIDIGKIQNTVTTFFDPAYNDVKEETNAQGNLIAHSQDQSCLEMLVVPSEQAYNYQANYHSIPSNSYSTYEYNPSTSQQSYQNINYQAVPQTYNAAQNRMESVDQQNNAFQQANQSAFSNNEYVLQPTSQSFRDNQDMLESAFRVEKGHTKIASQNEVHNVETAYSYHSENENDLLVSSSQQTGRNNQQSVHNFDTEATPQNYFSFIDNNQTEKTSEHNIHSVQDEAVAQSSHDDNKGSVTEQYQQNLNIQQQDQNNANDFKPQLKHDKDFFGQQTDMGKEPTEGDLADFDEERFNETRAAIEALVKAFLPEEPKPKPKEEPLTGPGFIISMGPIDDSVDPDSIYTRVISSEPLTKEQHQKAFEELMNRPINIFDGDEQSHIIEPDSRSSTPEIPKKKDIPPPSTSIGSSNTNVIEPAPPVTIDYGYNSDYASQYFSDNNATQIFSSALKHDSSSDNTGSDSIRYFIPYKASQKELEMVARLGDMSLDTDYDVSTENSSALQCEDEDASHSKRDEGKETIDVTKQLIENITAPIQLSNPVEVPLPEPSRVIDDTLDFSSNQFAEISHITEETIETIQVQSATELLQDSNVDDTVFKNYIWRTDDGTGPLRDHGYTLNSETSTISHLPNTSMFFDNVLTNASDELKAECKHSLDEHHILPRQMSVPSAPPAEDSKSDEGTLDVQSIEQDAKKDFMFIHEMVIEPETDDGKIKELERTSDDHAQEVESFANRIDKFKKTTGDENDEIVERAATKTYPSYFDTGNFAADNHYKNAPNASFMSYGPSNIPMRIPPGFEQEFYRKCNMSNVPQGDADPNINKNENVPKIPDTVTQTATGAKFDDSDKVETSSDKINALVEQFIEQKREIKPRRMKQKRPFGTVPLAHTLGTDPEEIWELVGHQVSHSPPLPSTNTDEMIRERILAHLRHSPVGGEGNDHTGPIPTSNADGNVAEPVLSGARISALHYDNRTRRRSRETQQPQDIIDALTESSHVDAGSSETNAGASENVSLLPPEEFLPVHQDGRTANVTRAEIASSLPDPMSFFSAPSTSAGATAADDEEAQGFSRLSSYFAAPPTTKQDPTKSFFELSQSQNHYRQNPPLHTPTQIIQQTVDRFFDSARGTTQAANSNQTSQNIPQYATSMNLIRELTAARNFSPPNVVTTANYFTVHYDYDVINSTIGEPDRVSLTNKLSNKSDVTEATNLNELGETDLDETAIISACKKCCDISGRIRKVDFDNVDLNGKVKTFMDDNTDTKKSGDNVMEESADIKKKFGHTVNFDTGSLQEDPNEAVSMMSENRSSSEYSPVKFHWFYRVDVEGKSVWRGFSMTDSRALERTFHSPDLNENTLVPTDGGRFDVNVVARLRIAVYWSDKPTNVRRCSWFYKGTTDARYVPYTEQVAEKLEEEYRHGITTGEWHRRLMLPNNEMVVMHGPAVMVHFLQTGSDAFNSSPLFQFGKRVYRNTPKIRMAMDQRGPIDHLLLLVHGAGEFGHQRDKAQSMMRPRVVRRGHVESEIEDTEPSSIDHLLLLCHGVGSACDMRFRAVEEVVDDFRATSLQLLQSHYRNSYDNGLVGRIEVLPISWHSSLHSCETGVDRRLAAVTLDSIPRLRSFTNDTILDVLFYTSPVYCQHIIDTVCRELNRIYSLFKQRNPDFKGGVSLGGHSLGSVILYDLLCHQMPKQNPKLSPSSPDKQYVWGRAGSGQPTVKYPPLEFAPDALYALGSPIAIFECIRGVETLGQEFCLPTCKNFFNIFHPYDPIAYRIEPMINPDLRDVKPHLIPHHKGRKRMHLELKDTMARVGADIKQKIIESIKSTWSSVWRTPPPPDTHLEKVVEEEMEKEDSDEERKEEINEHAMASPDMLGKLNAGRRVDYVLQEAPFEMINEYLFAMRSHVCYWESEDTMLLILREIYDSLGIRPDCSVPQQSMTVQRTRILNDETIVTPVDSPSTSRDS